MSALPLALATTVRAQAWSQDPAFAPIVFRENSASANAGYASDLNGKILVYGDFTHVNGTAAPRFARFEADGTFDPSFLGQLAANEQIVTVAPLADGRIVGVLAIGGTAVARFSAGILAGPSILTPPVSRVLVGPATSLVCWHSDGRKDFAFTPIACDGLVRLTALANGRVLAWGSFRSLGGVARNGLARLNPSGTLDPDFAPMLSSETLGVTALAPAREGAVVVSAVAYDAGGRPTHFLARLSTDGTVDSRFAPAAIGTTFALLAVQDDASVLAGNRALVRYTALGAVDPSFVPPDLGSEFTSSIAALKGGRFAVGLSRIASSPLGAVGVFSRVLTLTASGRLDRDLREIPGASADLQLLAALPDGRLLLSREGTTAPWLFLSTSDASALAPLATTVTRRTAGTVDRLETDSAGRLWVGGNFTHVNGRPLPGLARFLPGGALDSSFVPAHGYWLFLPPDGRAIVQPNARMREDGSIDPSFKFPADLAPDRVNWLDAAPDGRLLVAAFTSDNYREQDFKLVWLNPDGQRLETLSTAFSAFTRGYASIGGPLPVGVPNVIDFVQVLASGQLLVSGSFQRVNGTRQPGFVRLHRDGSIDSDYVAEVSVFRPLVLQFVPLRDGRALMWGALLGGDPLAVTTRLLRADGSLEQSFPPPTGGFTSRVQPLADGSFFDGGRHFLGDGWPDLNFVPRDPASLAIMAPDGSLWLANGSSLVRLVRNEIAAITAGPRDLAVVAGRDAFFQVAIGTAQPATFRWTRDGSTIAGATSAILSLPDAGSAQAGVYSAIVTIGPQTITSAPATLTVVPNTARLTNFSARSVVSPTAPPQIAGLGAAGAPPRAVLLRSIGRGLQGVIFGFTDLPGPLLPAPVLTLYERGGMIAQDRGGAGAPAVAALARSVGAFPLGVSVFNPISTTLGSALMPTLGPGNYTAITTSGDTGAGLSLFEFYDTGADSAPTLVRNLSILGQTAPGAGVLTGGFVIAGNGPLRLLVRGVGPALAAFGVTGFIADPRLDVFSRSASAAFATNSGWGIVAELAEAARRAGAFALPSGSRDAAVLLTLEPGAYTAQLASASGTTGTGMIEIYVVDF